MRSQGWGPGEKVGPESLMATGMFFEGSHQPNGTVFGICPDGEEVKVRFPVRVAGPSIS